MYLNSNLVLSCFVVDDIILTGSEEVKSTVSMRPRSLLTEIKTNNYLDENTNHPFNCHYTEKEPSEKVKYVN